MRQIVTESMVRQLRFREGKTTVYAAPDAYITREARDCMRALRMTLVQEPKEAKQPIPENRAIRPLEHRAGAPRFTDAETGCPYAEKPEQMTHLRGTQLVPKTHPIIRLRGRLDSLEAHIIQCAVAARERGAAALAADLADMLACTRAVLTAEVTQSPLTPKRMLGMEEAALRRVSQNPQQSFGRGHILPTVELSWAGAALNALRAEARETELAAADAFYHGEECERVDLIRALNRMSSAFYIMMFYELEGRYGTAAPAAASEKGQGK